jgi:hypothetical protein
MPWVLTSMRDATLSRRWAGHAHTGGFVFGLAPLHVLTRRLFGLDVLTRLIEGEGVGGERGEFPRRLL